MARVLNERDFYYGAFLFALLNKKIHPAAIVVVVKHFCNSTTYIFKNDIELHKEFDNHYMNVAYHGCTNHRQILRWNL